MSTGEGSQNSYEVQLQVPSKDWLEVYGLLAQGLTIDQLLPNLGFLQSTGHVEALQHSVTSQYGDGLFVQHQDSSGKVYNLCGANSDKLAGIESELQKALALFKARYNWLTTASRLSFGVIYERKVVLVLDSCATEHAQLRPFLDVAISVAKEQMVRMEQFNIICCCNGVETWRDSLTESGGEAVTGAVEWLQQLQPQTVPFKTNIVEGLVKALGHSEAQAVYLLSQGDCTLRAFDLLLEKVSPSLIPVHLVVYGCKNPQALDQYKQLANASSARCHSYLPPPVSVKQNPLLSSFSSLSSAGSHSPPPSSSTRPASGRSSASVSKPHPQPAAPLNPPPSPTTDVAVILEEIELTRNTLAEVQALQLEVSGVDLVPLPAEQQVSEESLTSQQWLEIYGLKAKKLRYEDLVSSLAFQHCNGIVQIPVPKYKKSTQTIEVVPHTKIVHAQYCKDFVHIRWNTEKTVHVQLTNRVHKTYRAKVEGVIRKCEERLEWLKKGSRQLFGTLLESKVVILIDTSSSLKERLDLIKNKVEQLLQEQLCHKKEFTIMHFNSDVHPWRTSLVPTSPQNLQAVGHWVCSLQTAGSTNTLRALETAMTVRDAEAVYLLTDGRPDQPLDQVLARVQQLPSIPVHTISFNCADSKANFFLDQLASNTGGRYYYFSEDTSDPEGPNTYQGEDIQKLEEEVTQAHEEMQLADHLLSECNAVRKRGRKKEGSRKRGSKSTSTARRKSGGSGKLMSSKKWLEKNSLTALHLTLMDAFGPAAIPHTSKHIPTLGKRVASKVFSSLFPLAHVTNGDQVTLIHPNGVNLVDYETRLDKQVQVYWDRLTRLAWSELSEDKRAGLIRECGLEEEGGVSTSYAEGGVVPSYKEHRDKLREALSESGWPRPQKDFDLLEEEIELGGNFKTYLEALKKEAVRSSSTLRTRSHSTLSDYTCKWSDEDDGEVVGLYSPTSLPSLKQLSTPKTSLFKTSPSLKTSLFRTSLKNSPYQSAHAAFTRTPDKKKQVAPSKRYRRGQHVAVRPSDEGFYYPGVVTGHAGRNKVTVQLVDKEHVTAPTNDIIIVGGASPCPVLAVGDYVLARVRTRNGPHPSKYGRLSDCYIPGTVQGCPEDIRKAGALYLVLDFANRRVICSRYGIIKIGRSKYNELHKFLRENGTRSLRIVEYSDDESSNHTHSSSPRGSVHIPSVEVLPRPSDVTTATPDVPMTSSPEVHTPSPADHLQSHSRSRSATRSTNSAQSHSGSRPPSPQAAAPESPPSFSEREDVKLILEQQKAQGELLERQQREIALVLLRQQELEEQVKTQQEDRHLSATPRQESIDFFESVNTTPSHNAETSTSPPPPIDIASPHTPSAVSPGPPDAAETTSPLHVPASPLHTTTSLEDKEESRGIVLCDQAMNTDVWTEERGVVTDPMTESRGVGTEWSSVESEFEKSISPKSSPDHGHVISTPPSSIMLSTPQFTPVSTPVPTPLPTPKEEVNRHLGATPTSATPTVTPTHVTAGPTSATTTPTAAAPTIAMPTVTPTHVTAGPTSATTTPITDTPTIATPTTTPTHLASTSIVTTPTQTTPLATSTPSHQQHSSSLLDHTLTDHTHLEAEEDPLINQYVLARWPDDGWYYRGLVVAHLGQMWYQVKDASEDVEKIHALDIIIDLQDAQRPLLAGNTVAALHPSFDHSYAPGIVKGAAVDGFHFSVLLYDGTEAFLPRHEIYRLAPAKYQQDVELLQRKESLWVGQAVLARRDRDGLYLPGEVLKQLEGVCQYLIEWADGTTQVQEVMHMFGKLTKKRGLRLGDHVLALAVPDQGVCMPGTITGKVRQDILVEFCDGNSCLVDPAQCFWLSSEYYQQAVEYIADNVSESSTTSSTTSLEPVHTHRRQQRSLVQSETESDLTVVSSEYTPSYLH